MSSAEHNFVEWTPRVLPPSFFDIGNFLPLLQDKKMSEKWVKCKKYEQMD